MVYVALLRGINVGGNNKIDMKQLKQAVEQLGFQSVRTYINTGNIIFDDGGGHSKAEIAKMFAEAIYIHFGLQIKVLVLSMEEIKRIMSALPDHWSNDEKMKSDVLFLWEEHDDESVLDLLNIKPEIDSVIYVPGAILWSIDRQNATKSGMHKMIGTKIYRHITVRNVNTTRKIFELMQQVEKD